MTRFRATDPQLIYQPKDPADTRLAQKLIVSPEKATVALLGYPDDEGIHLNGGRRGACEGPDTIRKFLFRMTEDPHQKASSIYDCGNLDLNPSLEERHEIAAQEVHRQLCLGSKTIGLGGGHDYGYVDGKAFLEYCREEFPGKKPLIINFDAHLDVRPTTHGLSSGTPFFRLFELGIPFDFLEIGIQPQCNSKAHRNWCVDKGVQILERTFEESESDFLQKTQTLLRKHQPHTPCFVSVDIDYFDSSYAQGCSQSWPTGLGPTSFFKSFEEILSRFLVLSLGIYEVSPPLDKDDQTSKLAALIAYKMVGSR